MFGRALLLTIVYVLFLSQSILAEFLREVPPRARPSQEGVFLPDGQPAATAPFDRQGLRVGELVRIRLGRPSETIEGRIVSIDSKELVLNVNGGRRAFLITDLSGIERVVLTRTGRTVKWLTFGGLAGVVAAYWFGRIG